MVCFTLCFFNRNKIRDGSFVIFLEMTKEPSPFHLYRTVTLTALLTPLAA